MVRLKDICDVDWGDTNLTKQAYVENGKYLGVSAGGCDGRMDYYDFEAYTPVISAIGANCGKMFLPEEPFVAIKNTITLKPHKDILGKYIFYALNSNKIPHRGGGQPFISKTDTEEYMIICPSLEEQTRIVTIFDKICKIIDMRHNQLSKLDELVKSRFVELFVDKDFPKTTIGELVASKVSSVKKVFLPTDTIKYIDISSIDNKRNIMTGFTEYVLEDAPSRAQQHIRKGDIVVSTVRPNLKNVAITGYDYDNLVASSGFCVLRAEKCLPSYLMAVVCSDDFTDAMTKVVTGANYPAIKDSDVKNYVVPNPPVELQEQFAAFVEQIDKSKFEIQKSLEKLETLKKALIQKYFG